MKAVVHKPLGNVQDLDSGAIPERAHVQNALVGHATALPSVERRIMRLQPPGDVIGIEDCDSGRLCKAARTHESDIGPRNGQDARASPWRG